MQAPKYDVQFLRSEALRSSSSSSSRTRQIKECKITVYLCVSYVMFLSCKHVRLTCVFNKLMMVVVVVDACQLYWSGAYVLAAPKT